MTERRRSSLGILFLIVFTDLLGFGIVIPLLPRYAETYAASIEDLRLSFGAFAPLAPLTSSPTVFLSLCLGILLSCYSLFQFLFSPVWGRLSDRIGRRPVLVLSLLGSAIGYALFAVSQSIPMLILSRSIAGIMAANIATAQAYIADVTSPQDRAKGMGVVGAAFGLGFSLGPFVGGFLASLHETAAVRGLAGGANPLGMALGNIQGLPGLFAALLSTIALVLTLLLLPESLSAAGRAVRPPRRARWRAIRDGLRHPQLGTIFLLFFIYTFGFTQMEVTLAQLIGFRFGLDIQHSYWLFAWVGLLGALVQGVLIGPLSRWLGERVLASLGMLLVTVTLGAISFVPGVSWLVAALALLALGAGITTPSLSALVSRLTSASEQGGAFGIFQSISSIARIVGPVVAQLLYQKGEHVHAPYLLAAGAGLVGFVMSLRLLSRPIEQPGTEPREMAVGGGGGGGGGGLA